MRRMQPTERTITLKPNDLGHFELNESLPRGIYSMRVESSTHAHDDMYFTIAFDGEEGESLAFDGDLQNGGIYQAHIHNDHIKTEMFVLEVTDISAGARITCEEIHFGQDSTMILRLY